MLLIINFLSVMSYAVGYSSYGNGYTSLRVPTYTHTSSPSLRNGDHIPIEFYKAASRADQSKQNLQNQLRNFLDNLHKNLTTSTLLNGLIDSTNPEYIKNQMGKLNELTAYFESSAENALKFGKDAELFFEEIKNTSNSFLLKLRQVPIEQPFEVKTMLTNYFTEMEFFHIMLSEVVDEALQYTYDTLRSLQKTFGRFADIQRHLLQNWNLKPDEECLTRYMNFLQNSSAQIFRCAAGNKLDICYDVYAMTEVTSKYIIRQLEFRIQRLFHCLMFGHLEIRCRFLNYPEEDFENLNTKIDELEMYLDIKTKRGRVSINRNRRRRRLRREIDLNDSKPSDMEECIPFGFPDLFMPPQLKACFYFFNHYQ